MWRKENVLLHFLKETTAVVNFVENYQNGIEEARKPPYVARYKYTHVCVRFAFSFRWQSFHQAPSFASEPLIIIFSSHTVYFKVMSNAAVASALFCNIVFARHKRVCEACIRTTCGQTICRHFATHPIGSSALHTVTIFLAVTGQV